jgi:phosphoribosylformimino-5-aminoimidazole carboxamide ribotide isomerase
MIVVPVIDLKEGVVVRGVSGRREEYRPIVSRLVGEPTPRAVARAFADQFGFREVYVADLDAIAGRSPNLAAYEQIADCGLTLWIDAGVSKADDAKRLPPANIIVGLESLASPDELSRLVESLGANHIIFSLDLKVGRPITRIAAWSAADSESIVSDVVARGIHRSIVLDLADVGVGRGTGTLDLVRRLRNSHPQLEITAGGGVRGLEDLKQLAAVGCYAALVASALHDGRITPEVVRWLQTKR